MAILEVDRLSAEFHGGGVWTRVVDEVSFAVDARETLAIVGESGSGKSVTALSIMRLLPEKTARVTGAIRLEGRDLLPLPETAMELIRGREIAMVFQEPMTSLNPVMTVGRQIAEVITAHRGLTRSAAEAEALRHLERVRIPAAKARLHEHPHQLSGGTLQRVMIAMALACRPKLLIADEPTTALDVTVQAQILRLIRDLQDEDGMGVLFITHDMGVVAEIADRVMVMRRSKVVESGEVGSIFAVPQEPYTQALIAAVPRPGAGVGPGPIATGAALRREPVLSIRNLVTRFDVRSGLLGKVTARVHAVENVSLDVAAGETLALVGESGCGKSTIGRSILRLVKPVSGSITVDGTDVLALKDKELTRHRRRMQMIFQDPMSSLNPRMRVGEALIEPMLAHRLASKAEALESASALLRRVGLDPAMMDRFPHQFSGGQKQRICIARALALDPALIVADEAVSALDVSVKAQVVELMQELQAEFGLAFLFISHDMAVVERISHRVAVMYRGEIVEIGPCPAVFGRPGHPYTRRLLAAVPIADPARRRRWAEVAATDPPSPLRSPSFVPPERLFAEIGDGHYVQMDDAA